MTTIKALIAFAVVGLLLSLSVATAAAEYPPSDPPADTGTTIPTNVGGIQQTSAANQSQNLAFTGRTIGEIAAVGGMLVLAGGTFWLVGQRRRPETL